jgi:hypothetical protein
VGMRHGSRPLYPPAVARSTATTELDPRSARPL